MNKDQTRREILTEQLRKSKYECMVCYQYIRNDKPIWSCHVCFHIFHLQCIKKWANSSTTTRPDETTEAPSEWRCPGCQTPNEHVPTKSTCFCTKKLNPEQVHRDNNRPFHYGNKHQLAHSCGEVCGKLLALSAPYYSDQQDVSASATSNLVELCKHKCVLLCHPGPCPQCESMVTRACKCGKSKFQVKCSSVKLPLCDRACERMLACGLHVCDKICHSGECEPCAIDVEQRCSSHGDVRVVKCGSAEHKSCTDGVFQCENVCGKELACKNHTCEEKCHSGGF